ncbi:MAG: DNA repair protein RadC [Treponema sp.]|nr:DNA repair protein RadC [Spirochaetia bacterium]MDD7769234.1 DNA repair protein RadC [Treponema sp.]MDY3130849.1 DNA repair protein RadC [Treponema sp.]
MCKENNKPKIRELVLERGLDFPIDEELIMLILGTGSKNMPIDIMAKKIVEALDSSNRDDIVETLLKVNGIGTGKALAVAAALELGKRRYCHLGAHISHPDDIIPYLKNYAICQKEHFVAVTLNGGHDIIQIHVVSVGTVNRTLIHPREVFGEAIRENAAALILCHNHPSGRIQPSEEDVETTKLLLEASQIIGIPILDHIIIDKNGYFSFLEHNLLFETE